MRQADVIPILRKFPKSSLWNFEIHKWTPEQIKEFKILRDGKKEKKPAIVVRKMGRAKVILSTRKPVIRVADGKIYGSIMECAKDNNVSEACISSTIRGVRKSGKYEALKK